jgi:hypothetical protein
VRDPPALIDCCATLLEADPGLGRIVGVREAAAIGHRPVLPVLTVDPGPWTPPERADLGPSTVALSVLEGLLTDGATVLGPGDGLEPWDTGARWTACTPLRLAVIGRAYAEALDRWPAAADRRRAGSGARVPSGGAVEDRLLELLWRIALRWGVPAPDGVRLPPALDLPALRRILGIAATDVVFALAALRVRGATIRDGTTWRLLGGRHEDARRDTLLAGAALQLALARAARDDCLALCELLELQLGRGARRGGPAAGQSPVSRRTARSGGDA